MKRTNLLFPAFCLLLGGCGIPQTEQTVHSVLLTRPVQAGEGQTLDFSGIVRGRRWTFPALSARRAKSA